jgi:lambda family phage portal protein
MGLVDSFDRLVAALSPETGARRAAARLAMAEAERLSGSFRGSTHSRIDRSSPTMRGAGADWTLERGRDRRELVDRARGLERDSVLAAAMLSRATESVVGAGFGLQAKTGDDGWNDTAEALWKDWTLRADSRGMCSFGEILALAYRSWLRDGDVGLLKQANGTIRVLESDEIASPEGYPRPELVDGVELNQEGRPVAFHVLTTPIDFVPDRRLTMSRTRIPANYVEFMARRERAGQTRGLSAFSNVAWLLDQIDGNLEAVTVANRMAACLGLVFKRGSRMSGLPTVTTADGIQRKKLRLEPAGFMEIDKDDEITTVQGHPANANLGEFLRILGRMASIAFGLPLEITFMDFEKTNYSNARAALLQAWNVWRIHQAMLKGVCTRIYTWQLLNWMEAGLLPARRDALEHRWQAPGWQWIDPTQEVQSALAAVDAGFKTRADVVSQMGGDFEDMAFALEKERRVMEKIGPVAHSTLTRDEAPPPAPAEAQATPAS